jgi:hypothetical protein
MTSFRKCLFWPFLGGYAIPRGKKADMSCRKLGRPSGTCSFFQRHPGRQRAKTAPAAVLGYFRASLREAIRSYTNLSSLSRPAKI